VLLGSVALTEGVYGERRLEEPADVRFQAPSFPGEIILLLRSRYFKFGIMYLDLAEMMRKREVEVDASTILRPMQFYAPEIEKRIHRYQQVPI
jgi:transposase, IS6 family